MKSGLVSVNTARQVNAAHSKTLVNAARPMSYLSKTVHLTGNPQMDLQDQGVIDNGCSRHMTRNMSYLTNYEEKDGGYVAFGGNPKREKITGKEDHLAKFHKMTDAKDMWNAIKSRFGGNDESKKMQKYILKQQFEGFSGILQESVERRQRIEGELDGILEEGREKNWKIGRWRKLTE
ncbi:hypothetical protein Tco_0755125 [Tanacetum coccineum]